LLMAKESGITDEKSGITDDLDLKAATTEALKEIEDKIKETYKNQETLVDSILTANEDFVKSKGSDASQIQRENLIHTLNQSCEKFNKCKTHLKDGLKFYTDLMADYVTRLQTTVDDFVMARESERDMNLADLNTNVAKLGIDAYGNMSSSSSKSSPDPLSQSRSQFSSSSQSQPQSQFQSQSQPQSSVTPTAPSYNPSYNPSYSGTTPPTQQQWGGYQQQWQQPPPQYYGGPPPQYPYGGVYPPPQNYGSQPPPQAPPQYGAYPPYYGQQPSNPYYGNSGT